VLDYADPSVAALKRLLLHCMIKPLVLRCAEGRKLLVYLFGEQLAARRSSDVPRMSRLSLSALSPLHPSPASRPSAGHLCPLLFLRESPAPAERLAGERLAGVAPSAMRAGLHPPFIAELHRAIKAQIPVCRKSLRDLYGEIYFRAWRAASGASSSSTSGGARGGSSVC